MVMLESLKKTKKQAMTLMNHAWTVSTPVCALLKVSLFSVWMSCKY